MLQALSVIMDPDLGKNIVDCGFVHDLAIDLASGAVSLRLNLTTPACPVKDEFKRQAEEAVRALDWVTTAEVAITASPPAQVPGQGAEAAGKPGGLRGVRHIIAVSSCKGGGCRGRRCPGHGAVWPLLPMGPLLAAAAASLLCPVRGRP